MLEGIISPEGGALVGVGMRFLSMYQENLAHNRLMQKKEHDQQVKNEDRIAKNSLQLYDKWSAWVRRLLVAAFLISFLVSLYWMAENPHIIAIASKKTGWFFGKELNIFAKYLEMQLFAVSTIIVFYFTGISRK